MSTFSLFGLERGVYRAVSDGNVKVVLTDVVTHHYVSPSGGQGAGEMKPYNPPQVNYRDLIGPKKDEHISYQMSLPEFKQKFIPHQ